MNTVRRQEANRKNALRSTGPRTAEGKERSRNNARRHGLATKVGSVHSEQVRRDQIASMLAMGTNDGWIMERALHVAECQVQLERVKTLTAKTIQELINANLNDQAQVDAILGRLKKLESYERKARSRRKNAIREFSSITAG